MLISSDVADELYLRAMNEVILFGEVTEPRGMKTSEVLGAQLRLTDVNQNVITHDVRGLNYQFMVAEFLWMVTGQNRVDLIQPFNKNIVMAADDGQAAFQGAYGPKIMDQMPYILEVLREDPDSRQAVLTIWRERPRRTRDVPCTVSMQFFIRRGKLIMVTNMRSNDMWLGLPYDLFNFTMIQRLVAHYLSVEPGEYIHNVGSLHLYERNGKSASELVSTGRRRGTPSLSPFQHAPLGAVSAAFTELATLGPQWGVDAPDEARLWYHKWYDAGVTGAWAEMLLILARRFIEAPVPAGWEEVL